MTSEQHLPHRRRARASRALPALAALTLLALVTTLIAACGARTGDASPAADGRVQVVATTTVFADMVRQVGGDRVSVESLVPKGGEVHTFDPKPSDVRRIADAQLVVRNGLGLDDWLGNLVEDAGTKAPVVALAEDLPGVEYLQGEAEDGSGGEAVNPHVWMNIAYGSLYAGRIAEALAGVDPAGAATYQANATAYQARLATLDADAKARLGAIPASNRTVVSFHDAFPYFAAAYGLTVDGSIVSAPGQDPSAGEVATLIASIRDRGVKAIFAEAQFSDDLVRTIADETGATVVSSLYTDTVGDPPLDSYEAIMRWNVDEVVKALGG